MLAIGLARLAVEAGHRVYFTTAEDLAARATLAAREGRWGTAMRFYAGPRLLVIDEFGYRRLSEDGNAALFQVISQRYLKSKRGVDLPCRDRVLGGATRGSDDGGRDAGSVAP